MLRNLVSTSLIGFLLQWELRVDPLMCLLLNACTYEGVMNELKSATVVDSQTFAISGLNKGDTTPAPSSCTCVVHLEWGNKELGCLLYFGRLN